MSVIKLIMSDIDGTIWIKITNQDSHESGARKTTKTRCAQLSRQGDDWLNTQN